MDFAYGIGLISGYGGPFPASREFTNVREKVGPTILNDGAGTA